MEFRAPSEDVPAQDVLGSAPSERRRLRERSLLEGLGKKSLVIGLDDTLKAFNEGRLVRIVVREGFARMGRLCRWCQRPSLYESRCSGCNRRTEAVLDVVETLLKLARVLGCRVTRLRHESPAYRLCGQLKP